MKMAKQQIQRSPTKKLTRQYERDPKLRAKNDRKEYGTGLCCVLEQISLKFTESSVKI